MRYEESAVLELKEQVNADFKKEIIAFANTDGGEIFVGVAKDGSITGVENAEAEMERIGNMIRDGIKPDLTAYTAIEKVMEGGKALIHVTVHSVPRLEAALPPDRQGAETVRCFCTARSFLRPGHG